MIKNYKGLKVRQKAYQLCIKTYKITRGFPREERYGLTSQIMRAAVLVPSNIAEGYGRKTTQEYIQALFIAYGSNWELETQILLLGDLGYIKSLENKHLNPWTLFSNFFGEEPELFLPEFFQIRC